MKTLKKVLSLVLVVAMIASMLIVGAAAAEEDTQYDEAVAVVTGLGIIEGDENGMNFTGNVTREQAAKIISYLLLGKDTAEALKTSAAPFADVAASRWSAGYIAYLKGQGIISGVSDTEFDPTAPVTGIAFAKMLLTAAGYGANGEFEGKDWDINTITFANDNDIFEGTLAADLAEGATREEAMLYAFNLLTKVPTVKFNKTFESYYTGKSALDPITGDVDPTATTATDPYAYTLGWTKYELQQTTTGEDDFGRPAASWTADGVVVAADVATVAPDAVVYNSVNSGTIYNTIGKTAADALNKTMVEQSGVGAYGPYTYYTNANVTVYVDGDEYTTVELQQFKAGYLTGAVAGKGATTEFYLDCTNGVYSLTLVVYYEHIGKVTRVDAANNKLYIDSSIEVDGEFIDITGYAKNDYVIYTEGKTAVASIRAAEPVVGTYTGKDFMSMYLIDGVGHDISDVAVPGTAGLLISDVAYTVYYDALGNILMVEEYDDAAATGTYQYVYVADVEVKAMSTSLIDGAEAKVALQVAYANGGAAIVNYAVKYSTSYGYYITVNGVDYAITGADEVAPITAGVIGAPVAVNTVIGGWMTYTTNDDGAMTLKATNATYATVPGGALTLQPNKATTGVGFTVNSKTVLTIVDALGNATVYNGIANLPILDTSATNGIDGLPGTADDVYYSTIITHAKDSTLAKAITVYTTAAAPTSPVYAYVVMSWGETTDTITYFAYVDGIPQFITVEKPSALTFGMYEVAVWTVDSGVNSLTSAWATNTWAFSMDPNTYAVSYFETATIDTVDDNFFTTVAVAAEDAVDSVIGSAVPSTTYYYDANTVIYDCVNGGIVTELDEGANFLAVCDATASTVYDEATYCTYIWIVG